MTVSSRSETLIRRNSRTAELCANWARNGGWCWQGPSLPGRGWGEEHLATERTHGKNSRASAGEVGGFQAAVFAQHAEQRQAGNHRRESCRAQNKEVRNLVVKRMGVRRPGFMRLRGG